MADVLDLPDPPVPCWTKRQVKAREDVVRWFSYVLGPNVSDDVLWWRDIEGCPVVTLATSKHNVHITIEKDGELSCNMYHRISRPGHPGQFGPFHIGNCRPTHRGFFTWLLPQILVTTLEEIDFEIKAMEAGKDL